jgi:enamine deaminase RidA (YjgF/YER057c/UK114 family)
MPKKVYPLQYAKKHKDGRTHGSSAKGDWYSKAVVVPPFVFLSGMSGRTFETGKVESMDVRVQTRRCFSKIKAILDEVGTTPSNIVKVTHYIARRKDIPAVIEETAKWYEENIGPSFWDNPPTDTLTVAGLYTPDMLVEIDVTAVLPEKK